jgi:hypothetical protein
MDRQFDKRRIRILSVFAFSGLLSFLSVGTDFFTSLSQYPPNKTLGTYFSQNIHDWKLTAKSFWDTFNRMTERFPYNVERFNKSELYKIYRYIATTIGVVVTLAPLFILEGKKRLLAIIPIVTVFFSVLMFVSTGNFYYYRYAYVLIFSVVACYIQMFSDVKYVWAKWAIIGVLLLATGFNLPYASDGAGYDSWGRYSAAQDVAEWLYENGYDNDETLIISDHSAMGTTILAYMRNVKTFTYQQGKRSYSTWQDLPARDEENPFDVWELYKTENKKNKIAVLRQASKNCEELTDYLVYSSPSAAFNEEYNVYDLNKNF